MVCVDRRLTAVGLWVILWMCCPCGAVDKHATDAQQPVAKRQTDNIFFPNAGIVIGGVRLDQFGVIYRNVRALRIAEGEAFHMVTMRHHNTDCWLEVELITVWSKTKSFYRIEVSKRADGLFNLKLDPVPFVPSSKGRIIHFVSTDKPNNCFCVFSNYLYKLDSTIVPPHIESEPYKNHSEILRLTHTVPYKGNYKEVHRVFPYDVTPFIPLKPEQETFGLKPATFGTMSSRPDWSQVSSLYTRRMQNKMVDQNNKLYRMQKKVQMRLKEDGGGVLWLSAEKYERGVFRNYLRLETFYWFCVGNDRYRIRVRNADKGVPIADVERKPMTYVPTGNVTQMQMFIDESNDLYWTLNNYLFKLELPSVPPKMNAAAINPFSNGKNDKYLKLQHTAPRVSIKDSFVKGSSPSYAVLDWHKSFPGQLLSFLPTRHSQKQN